MKKYTTIPKTAEEITGTKGCIEFMGTGWCYTEIMNNIAKKKEQIELVTHTDGVYDYADSVGEFFWKKEWLKDIREVEKTWKVGDSIRANQIGDIINLNIISIGRGECILLVKGSHNRWEDPIKVSNTRRITGEELTKMLGSAKLVEE